MLDSQPTVAWISHNCCVTVWRFLSKIFWLAWNVEQKLFDSRPTVAWPQTDCRVRVQRLFLKFVRTAWNVEKICLTVGQRSRDLRPLTVQRLFSKNFRIAWNVEKTLFDSRPTVAWPPTTVAWPFSDFFQNFPKLLETSKNVVWQSADGRVTSDHCRVTVKRLFSKFSRIAWNVEKPLFDSQPTVAWPPTTVPRPLSDFFQNLSELLESSKKKLFDSRPTVAWPPRTVAWPFSDFFPKFPNCSKRRKKLFDSRPTVAWPPTTVVWPFSDFFRKIPNLLERSIKVVWQSANSRVTSDHCRVTLQRLFSKFCHFCWNVQRKLFNSRPTVAWPPTTVAWPFSDFFQKISDLLETSKECCLTVSRRSRDLRRLSRDCSATIFKIL